MQLGVDIQKYFTSKIHPKTAKNSNQMGYHGNRYIFRFSAQKYANQHASDCARIPGPDKIARHLHRKM